MWRNKQDTQKNMDPKPPRRVPRARAPRVCRSACVLVPPAGLSGMLGRRARLEQAQARSGAFETEYAATYREDDLARSRARRRAGRTRAPVAQRRPSTRSTAARFDRVGQGETLCAGGGGTGRLGRRRAARARRRVRAVSHDAGAFERSVARAARARARARGRGGRARRDGGPPPLVAFREWCELLPRGRAGARLAGGGARPSSRSSRRPSAARADRDRLAAGAAALRTRRGRTRPTRGCSRAGGARSTRRCSRSARRARGSCRATASRSACASSGSPTAPPYRCARALRVRRARAATPPDRVRRAARRLRAADSAWADEQPPPRALGPDPRKRHREKMARCAPRARRRRHRALHERPRERAA